MPNLGVHFSSRRKDWETPPDLFAELDAEFGFDLDVCALPHNTKCRDYFTPHLDGLQQTWAPRTCWMNPPYGRVIKDWVAKAYEAALCGATVVGLLPSRTDTQWFHRHIWKHAEIRYIEGRITFVGAENAAPFPSMIVVWRPVDWTLTYLETTSDESSEGCEDL